MRRALQLARQGQGHVEPNPQVGCVIARQDQVLAEGWHRSFGGHHAEVDALRQLERGHDLSEASLYVTLEPCCHTGKTPPCTEAILKSGLRRVVVSIDDPFPAVAGMGIQQLRRAGLEVVTGICEDAGRQLLAPYLKLQRHARPWIIAKWAMTLDGKLATTAGSSQWISNVRARAVVHQIRGRMDGILVGRRTAVMDNPLLTARPPGPRTPCRIVFDSDARLADDLDSSRLAQTASEAPVLVFASDRAQPTRVTRLESAQFEVVVLPDRSRQARVEGMLDELGRRNMTNVLVEGGAALLGNLLDANQIDEVHAFLAAKVVGGLDAPSAIHGRGIRSMDAAILLQEPQFAILDDNVYVHGRLKK